MQTPIERMYRAGKEYIPAQAENLSTLSYGIRSPMDTVDEAAALMGDPTVMRDMLGVCDMVFEALRRGVTSLNNCAHAVVATADEYVDTDDRAEQDYNRLNQDLKAEEIDDAYAPGRQGPTADEGSTVTEYDDNGRPHVDDTESTPDPEQRPEDDRADRDEETEDDAVPVPDGA